MELSTLYLQALIFGGPYETSVAVLIRVAATLFLSNETYRHPLFLKDTRVLVFSDLLQRPCGKEGSNKTHSGTPYMHPTPRTRVAQ